MEEVAVTSLLHQSTYAWKRHILADRSAYLANALSQALDAAQTLDDIRSAHAAYLQTVRRLRLSEPERDWHVVASAITAVLNAVLQFCALVRSSRRERKARAFAIVCNEGCPCGRPIEPSYANCRDECQRNSCVEVIVICATRASDVMQGDRKATLERVAQEMGSRYSQCQRYLHRIMSVMAAQVRVQQ